MCPDKNEKQEDQSQSMNPSHPQYHSYRVQLMKDAIKAESGDKGEITLKQVVKNLETRAQSKAITASTLQRYKTWVRKTAQTSIATDIQEEVENQEALDTLERIRVNSGGDTGVQDKARTINAAQLDAVYRYIQEHPDLPNRAPYKALLFNWLRDGILIGARPAEWARLEVLAYEGDQSDTNDFKMVIRLPNLKHNPDTGYSPHRTLILNKLQSDEKRRLMVTIVHLQHWFKLNGYEKVWTRCRKNLISINKKLWPEASPLTLYTPRHQFKTNCAQSLPQVYVAALMGHMDTNSSGAYGTVSGKGSFKTKLDPNARVAMPTSEEVLAIMAHKGIQAEAGNKSMQSAASAQS